jgi:hypothetical protein
VAHNGAKRPERIIHPKFASAVHKPPPTNNPRPRPSKASSAMDSGRGFSARAREEWMRKEEQAHEAVRAMLRRLDEKEKDSRPSIATSDTSLIRETNDQDEKPTFSVEEVGQVGVRRRVMKARGVDGVRRSRRMGKFVEHLPSEEEVEEMEEVEATAAAAAEEKAAWRLSRVGPKIVSYERAPWEEDEPEPQDGEEDEERQSSPVSPTSPVYVGREVSPVLEDIAEDEEDIESPTVHSFRGSSRSSSNSHSRPKLLTPPAESTSQPYAPSPASHLPIYKLPADIFPAPPTPRSPISPTVSDLSIPTNTIATNITQNPPKSPTNLRARAGLKKIFLSIRPRKRDDEPLSPTPTLTSSTVTTPSLPTPTIRITSPIHARRFDGSPIGYEHPSLGKSSPIESVSYRLPELRLSRADWGEWGRQVAERL